MKIAVVCVLLAFGVGSCVGNSTDPTPKVEFVKITKTKIVTAEPEPAPPAQLVMPDSCVAALRYARQAAAASERMYQSGDTQLDLISDARKALADGSNVALDLNAVEDRQRNLQGNAVGALSNLTEYLYSLERAQTECKEEVQ